jgi:hypothetical protein
MNASGIRGVANQIGGLKSALQTMNTNFEGLTHADSYSPGWLTFGSPVTVAVRKSAINDVVYMPNLPLLGATIRLRSGGHDVDLAYSTTGAARTSMDAVMAWLNADNHTNLTL